MAGEFEQVVLLALAAFDGEASGREVYERLTEDTGRDVSVAAVHITLVRLDEKGWAGCRTEPPGKGQGGKPRRYYRLSEAGAQLLEDLRRQLDHQWAAARQHPLLRRGAGS